jgi:hypothetical protein
VALRHLPSLPSGSRDYLVTLERLVDGTTKPASRRIGAQAGANGMLQVYLDPSSLPEGDYQISIVQPAHSEHFAIRISTAR